MKIPNKIYSTSIVFVLASLALIAFLILPTFWSIKGASEDISSNKEKTALILTQNQELQNFKKSFTGYESNLSKIEQLFVDPQNPVEFIKFLENVAYGLNVKVDINLIDSKGAGKDGNLAVSSFRVYIMGDFKNVLKFSEKLESGPYLLSINRLSVNKFTKEQQSPDAVEANFELQVINKQS